MIPTFSNLLLTRSAPFSLVHFVTERCNAHCSHCFVDFQTPVPAADELSAFEIEKMLPTLGNQVYNVNLTGGEPFLREDLSRIVADYATKTSIRSLVITTNGWFSDKIRNLLTQYAALQSSCRLTVSVSLDGPEAYHDRNRDLQELFRHATETCRMVAAWHDPRVSLDIAITVTPWNKEPLQLLYRQLKESGLDNAIVPILMREQGKARLPSDINDLRESYRWMARLSDTARRRSVHNARSATERFITAIHNAKNRISHDLLAKPARYRRLCPAGSLFGVIAANGNVYPCEPFTMSMGNLRKNGMDFKKVWSGTEAVQVRKQLAAKRCHCSYECAMTVNILSDPALLPKIALTALKELL